MTTRRELSMAIGVVMIAIADPCILLFTDSTGVLVLTKDRLVLICLTNFITCTMEVLANSVRALKRPRVLLWVGIVCGFAIRSGRAWFVWPLCKTMPFLFVCLPLSTLVGSVICIFVYRDAFQTQENLARRGTAP